jgi:hypothetical protein
VFIFQRGGVFASLHRRIVGFHCTRGANWFRSYCLGQVYEVPLVSHLLWSIPCWGSSYQEDWSEGQESARMRRESKRWIKQGR